MSNYSISCNDAVTSPLSGIAATPDSARRNGGLMTIMKVWIARSRQRRQLGKLPARLLDDIGVSATEAAEEAAKPFWVK